ncbi:MAG: hypothetical protein Q9M92_14100 [Enterobacterales bacterium]|nr:hypothetical protein [Enterobacterales bacterium]
MRLIIALIFIAMLCGCSTSRVFKSKEDTTEKKRIATTVINNIQEYENVRSTYTSCDGKPKAAWVVVSPRTFPEEFAGRYAVIQFLVNKDSKPYAPKLIAGSARSFQLVEKSLEKVNFHINLQRVGK